MFGGLVSELKDQNGKDSEKVDNGRRDILKAFVGTGSVVAAGVLFGPELLRTAEKVLIGIASESESTVENGLASAASNSKYAAEEAVDEYMYWTSSRAVKEAIDSTASKYNLPRWFLCAIASIESGFNPNLVNYNDGIEDKYGTWSEKVPGYKFTVDGRPHGEGLFQLTGWCYLGSLYPYNLNKPDDSFEQYRIGMHMDTLKEWISMTKVSKLEDPMDPMQNGERFATGFAVPAFLLFAELYKEDPEETLKRVAFAWNHGVNHEYDPEDQYVKSYNERLSSYKAIFEELDGKWDGKPEFDDISL